MECKWRFEFVDGRFTWGDQGGQLKRYRDYAKLSGLPVFLVLGVGGAPNRPNEVFVLPLGTADDEPYTRQRLSPFRRLGNRRFFYDLEADTLR